MQRHRAPVDAPLLAPAVSIFILLDFAIPLLCVIS
jgi:hypothetical protein